MFTAKRSPLIVVCAVLLTALLLSACGNKEDSQAEEEPRVDLSQPVDLSFWFLSASVTEEVFNYKIAQPVKEKYPQFNLIYNPPGGVDKLSERIVAGTIPDIYWLSMTEMRNGYLGLDLQYDLSDLVQAYRYDLERFDPSAIQTIRNLSGGRLYGLPDSFNPLMMFYNKEIFDLLGVNYPRDGMTWDEAHQLATALTRNYDGRQYRGLTLFYRLVFNGNSQSLPLVDVQTGKALVNNNAWKDVFDNFKRFYELPGMLEGYGAGGDGGGELNRFYQQRNIGMVVSPLSSYTRAGFDELDWDMVASPTFANKPGIGFQSEPRMYHLSSQSQHKDQAFHVLMHLLSNEVQTINSKQGQMPSLNDDAVRRTFGEEIEALQGKNTMAVYYNTFAPTPQMHPQIKTDAARMLGLEFDKVITGQQDVNTALRVAEEVINRAIEAELQDVK